MTLAFLKRKKFWKRFVLFAFIAPVILFFTVLLIVYAKQDAIVRELIETANKDFKGAIRIKGSHVAPFANFPYISIDIEGLEIFEGDDFNAKKRILHIKDTYIGFDLTGLLTGKYDVKSIRLTDGDIRLVRHLDGSFNIAKAFETDLPPEKVKEEFHLDLKSIKLDKIDLSKYNESNGMMVDAYITKTTTSFKTTNKHLSIGLDSKFELSLIQNGDTTFINRKHFEVDTQLDLDELTQVLSITETEVLLEGASFQFGGNVDFKDEANVDLHFKGNKQNFDLYLAMLPKSLAESLKEFDNHGKIFFNARIKGKTMNGRQPQINAKFGCENGNFNNLESKKKLEKIGFKGSFTNGSKRDLSTMRLELENFSAKPEAGTFKGKLLVENFDSPDIDMNLISDFDLDFLSKFLNTKELKGLSGRVILNLNFHDIIDLNNPEKSIERLNESYYSKLEIKKLKFRTSSYHLPLENLDLKITMEGHEAKIEHCNMKIGKSDLNITGSVSDLPSIIHHSSDLVSTNLKIKSKFLDINELTSGEKNAKPFDEQIKNLSLSLKFLSSAKAISESKTLPIGEFFIEDLHAKMKHYPHELKNFHADLFVDENDFRLMDFSGMIDDSDFHFSGRLDNYNIWFDEKIKGDTRVEFDLTSKLLQFDNVFTYGGSRFVPEDYRHEEINNLKLHGITDLHFDGGLISTDFQLEQFDGKLKIHPLKFEQFKGRVHLENEFLTVEQFKGKMGHSNFSLDMNYNLSKTKSSKSNFIHLSGSRLDVDELLNYQSPPAKEGSSTPKVNHDAVFSIYDFDFPSIHITTDIGQLNYHKYKLQHLKADVQSEGHHVVHIKKLAFDAAGGHMDIAGYLSGKDKKHIYFKPDIKVSSVDLDKLMVKFDNFGQDHLVSENLHGKFTGRITGKIHLHADLVPKINDSEIIIEMIVLNGRLENYGPILALSDYFEDNKLKSVVFDTLRNTLTIKKSVIEIPTMNINSNLGFIEIHGNQKISDKMGMDYLIGVPWEMVTKAAGKKLFKRSKTDESSAEEIQYRSDNSKLVYVRMSGDLENYNIKLAKKPK
ncbi:MAG: AsmA-like C-terminal region-containing protein [Cryomorphaceae bacterium]|nr:AsmA-like C-terminal region-containing protein [Cryomorphaceae bacterium]